MLYNMYVCAKMLKSSTGNQNGQQTLENVDIKEVEINAITGI